MWAGGRLTIHEPLRIGDRLTRTSTIRSVSLDAELALWVEQAAAGEHRSTSNYVSTLLHPRRDEARATAAAAPLSKPRRLRRMNFVIR